MRQRAQWIFALAALALPAPAPGQAPPAAQGASGSSYIATGPTTEAELARLRAALGRLPGIQQVDLIPRAAQIIVRLRGTGGGTLAAAAARSVGYNLRQMPRRTYFASGLGANANTAALRETLGKSEGVERVEIAGPAGGAMVRVLGDVKASALSAVARTAGFDLRRISSYVASGSSAKADITRLRRSLEKVEGVSRMDAREVAGGVVLRIHGAMEDAALTTAAKSAGFGLLPLNDLAGGQFRVDKELDAAEEARLRNALQEVADIGDVQIRRTQEGTRLSVQGGRVLPEVIAATAKAAGFYLRADDRNPASPDGADVEQDTPPAPNDRILEEITKQGELAPDFTLLARDGKSKIGLSDYRGKKPVVLIFGSYT